MFTRESLFIFIAFAILGVVLLGASALIGWIVRVTLRLQHNYGINIGLALATLSLLAAVYGTTLGFRQFRIERVEIASASLPAEFDGYRIIHFTDAHLGSFRGCEHLMAEAVDAMLRERADLIVFTGDLQNRRPSELTPFAHEMARLNAPDGVFAVLGNHDYGYPPTASTPRKVQMAEQQAGWVTLINEHAVIRRGSSRIILAGMDNDGDGVHFPQRGNVAKALTDRHSAQQSLREGEVTGQDFVIMLQHDPTSWRRNILPNSHAQLTLSGHTHAMQFGIGGWSPSSSIYKEWRGLFAEGSQQIFVSSGLGGVIPFRLGMPREFVVIELKKELHN